MKALVLLISFILLSNEFPAKVINITDGDTIVVLTNDYQQVKIRLEGIDCPESGQPYGKNAKKAASDLCFGKKVIVKKTGEDLYGRTLAYVYVDSICINKKLLEMGLAWHFKKYNSDLELAKLEMEARNKKIGLWSDSLVIAPWDWRKKQ